LSASGEIERHQVFLGLGSNIAPEENLPRALAQLRRSLQVGDLSSVWETPPVGGRGPNFLNAVARVYTRLPADELRNEILRPIETGLGRVRGPDPNAPRPIDLDILIIDGQVLEPEIWEQAYWSVPLAELIPTFERPGNGETLAQAARRLAQSTTIHPRPDVRL
jgi:2-amino-4-hydroxy-6-hydroxymethyldihydropteridine diphosphokinase